MIPTHRRPQLLAEAIESALAQTLAPCAVFVVDDAGDEPTRTVVEKMARASAIPVHYCAHGYGPGPSTSRNLGARAAEGADFIAFLDDDDRWLPGYLEAALAPADADLVLVGRWDFDAAGVRRPGKVPAPSYDERAWLRRNLGGTGSSTVIRRELFLAIGGFDPALLSGQDRDLILRAMRAGARYAAVSERLLEHREYGPRISRSARRILPARLRFLRKHVHAMNAGDVAYMLRKIARELRHALGRRA
ncbi:MAG TPA: glycosyltransferase family A protein [Myxococcota bacterium]|nr:glycosyltransferase family A protein [Myxococcota bacterium]